MASKPFSSDGKASACNAGDLGSIPGSERSPGEGNGKPLQYSCLENPMDGGAWGTTVHGVAELDTTEQLHSLTHSLNDLERWDGEVVRGRIKRDGIYTYLWLIHIVVLQKPAQHYEQLPSNYKV